MLFDQELPSRGRIRIADQDLPAEPTQERGVVFQRYSVFPHLNALENVALGLEFGQAPLLGRLFAGGARRRWRKAGPRFSRWALARPPTNIRPSSRAACSSALPSPRP
jgi:ABC-type sugar transport system ATPase subunit